MILPALVKACVLPSLLIPVLLGRIGRSSLMRSICVAFFAVGYTGLLLAPMTLTSPWTLLAGLGGGGFPLVLTLFGLRSATRAMAGALSGFAQSVGYLAAATGWLLVGGWLCSPTGTADDLRRRRQARAGD